ncbi:MAG: ATP-binding cassette domain-containing protein, partial [Clostridia bacterium]|nr:ATP-binding cassette domain-containing protein [Clostridia bacterium]
GLENVPEDRLNKIVELANIKEFIDELPDGLDTVVEEHGSNLSGGQKQRISIARALIRDPKIIILDEATSALDNISEYHVQKAMNSLIEGRTTFIVAHRLSTIRNADKIVVLEKGECVEFGTYDELMAKQGQFYQLKTLSDLTAK